jgi:hypothetical protein
MKSRCKHHVSFTLERGRKDTAADDDEKMAEDHDGVEKVPPQNQEFRAIARDPCLGTGMPLP